MQKSNKKRKKLRFKKSRKLKLQNKKFKNINKIMKNLLLSLCNKTRENKKNSNKETLKNNISWPKHH